MSNQQYIDPVLKKYADLIQAGTKGGIKRVFFGDPIRLGSSDLPALILAKIDTAVVNYSNVEDEHRMRISMTVVTDVRDTISEDKTMVDGVNALYNLLEGRQAGTYQLAAESILYVLRHNVELDSGQNLRTDLDSVTRIDYGMTMGKRGAEAWSVEGTLELTAHFIQPR